LPTGKLIPTAAEAAAWSMTSQACWEDPPGAAELASAGGDAALEGAGLAGPTITTAVEGLGEGLPPGPPDGTPVAADPLQAATNKAMPASATLA
jgi:hypothetical protein